MPRRAAATERGEEFLANPLLKAKLEALAGLVTAVRPQDASFAFAVIRDAAAILAVREHEAWIVAERLRIQTTVRNEIQGAK